ncbi:MAG: hypothetical protein Q9222_006921 [Ikaeria aurantiellina]
MEQKLSPKRYQTTQAALKTEDSSDASPPQSIFNRGERQLSIDEGHARFRQRIKDWDIKKKKKSLEVEMLFLQDPLKLAENTISLLRKDDLEKALEIVRVASKRRQCIVSWNHIIDYRMSKGHYTQAVKTYNEVCPIHPGGSMHVC